MTYLALFGIGLAAGVFSGMFGIGGGVVIVPAIAAGCFSRSTSAAYLSRNG